MSIEVMSKVWKTSALADNELLLLLAIADNANDDGVAWPGMEYLQHKIRKSESQTRRIIRRVETTPELYSAPAVGRGNKICYLVLTGMSREAIESALIKHFDMPKEKVSSVADEILARKGVIQVPEKVSSVSKKGVIAERKMPTTIEPSFNHNTESFTNVQDSGRDAFPELSDPITDNTDLNAFREKQATQRLQETTLKPLTEAQGQKEKVPPKRKRRTNVPPNPVCWMGGARYVGPFASMAAAQRFAAGQGTITDLSAVPAGVVVEAAPGKKPSVPPPEDGVMDALVGLCYPDPDVAWKMQGVAGRARKCYNALAACCAPITCDKLAAFKARWYKADFRGQKNQRPKFEQIPDAWLALMTGEDNGTNRPVLDKDNPDDKRTPEQRWGYA